MIGRLEQTSVHSDINMARYLWASIVAVLSLALAYRLASCGSDQQRRRQQDIGEVEWWKRSMFYHIYVRSFKDSNGDGQGDLRGVIEKLDYLKWLGVETLLMSPFYKSPMKDGGYDIDDYTAVNPLFGTMADFDELLIELKKRDMRIVLDFVPNHSSEHHKWFECSQRALLEPERCGKYKDYYIWSSRKRFNGSLPTNWINVFDGETAWTWSPIRKQFYYHQFLPQQPDLNLRNPQVRQEFKDIARFWLSKGAHGLRVDAAPFFLEDTYNYFDEPVNPDWTPNICLYDKLKHPYTFSLPGASEIVKDWRDIAVELGKDRMVIIEAYDESRRLVNYHGTGPDERFTDMVFGFDLLSLMEGNFTPPVVEVKLRQWYNTTRELEWPDERGTKVPWIAWNLGNHDQGRIVSRIGEHNLAFYQWLAFLAPGVPINYYGDELGTAHADPSQISNGTKAEGEPSRLLQRALMAWTDSAPSAGFSTTKDIWMPPPPNFKTHNVATMMRNLTNKNNLANFKRIVELRRQFIELLLGGELDVYQNEPADTSMVFAMTRSHSELGSLMLLANLDKNEVETVRLLDHQNHAQAVPKQAKILLISRDLDQTSDSLAEGKIIELNGLKLGPSQTLVLQYNETAHPAA